MEASDSEVFLQSFRKHCDRHQVNMCVLLYPGCDVQMFVWLFFRKQKESHIPYTSVLPLESLGSRSREGIKAAQMLCARTAFVSRTASISRCDNVLFLRSLLLCCALLQRSFSISILVLHCKTWTMWQDRFLRVSRIFRMWKMIGFQR